MLNMTNSPINNIMTLLANGLSHVPNSTAPIHEHSDIEMFNDYDKMISQYIYAPITYTPISQRRHNLELMALRRTFGHSIPENAPTQVIFQLPIDSVGNLNEILRLLFTNFQTQGQSDVVLPLTDNAIQNLQRKQFKDIVPDESNELCSICQEKYEQTSNIVILPCKHYFHEECVVQWLKNYHHKCPLCREPCGEYKPIDENHQPINEN